jgi:hypothetical protein
LEVLLNSQIIYSGFFQCRGAADRGGSIVKNPEAVDPIPNLARSRRCPSPAFASQYNTLRFIAKISLAKFTFRGTVHGRTAFVPFLKESQNGLESTKDRGSAGRHGNQHVCVRRPQVSERRP